ncbi:MULTISPECIES: hypothetical protein [unclassified Corynebacterium]|uniref:hypothetical protein n=1 Tax=unclassified Corynebacterium TaxID=2624378 RepID=UPI0030C93D01
MNVNANDRIIYIRELIHNLVDCAEDNLILSGLDDATLEPVCDILGSLVSAVDAELRDAGLLTVQPNPEFEGLSDGPVWQVCHQRHYSNGQPVYIDDGYSSRLNPPGQDDDDADNPVWDACIEGGDY